MNVSERQTVIFGCRLDLLCVLPLFERLDAVKDDLEKLDDEHYQSECAENCEYSHN